MPPANKPLLDVEYTPPRGLDRFDDDMVTARRKALEEAVVLLSGSMKTVISPRWGARHGKPRKATRSGRQHVGGSVDLGEPPTVDTGRMIGAVSFDVGTKDGRVGILSSVNYASHVDDRNPFLERTAEGVNEDEVFRWLEVNF